MRGLASFPAFLGTIIPEDFPEGMNIVSADSMIKPSASKKNAAGCEETIWYRQGLTRVNMAFGSAFENIAPF